MILRLSRCAERLWGFTLIELLVVVAIIGILVAIMVPAVVKARNQAIDSKTVGRMRKLGASYLLYMSENNSVPLGADQGGTNSDIATMYPIQTAIAPYLDLPETGDRRFASAVWWDGFAEINGLRAPGGGDANLYYPDPPAWPGGPPRNRMTGWSFNTTAHSTYCSVAQIALQSSDV